MIKPRRQDNGMLLFRTRSGGKDNREATRNVWTLAECFLLEGLAEVMRSAGRLVTTEDLAALDLSATVQSLQGFGLAPVPPERTVHSLAVAHLAARRSRVVTTGRGTHRGKIGLIQPGTWENDRRGADRAIKYFGHHDGALLDKTILEDGFARMRNDGHSSDVQDKTRNFLIAATRRLDRAARPPADELREARVVALQRETAQERRVDTPSRRVTIAIANEMAPPYRVVPVVARGTGARHSEVLGLRMPWDVQLAAEHYDEVPDYSSMSEDKLIASMSGVSWLHFRGQRHTVRSDFIDDEELRSSYTRPHQRGKGTTVFTDLWVPHTKSSDGIRSVPLTPRQDAAMRPYVGAYHPFYEPPNAVYVPERGLWDDPSAPNCQGHFSYLVLSPALDDTRALRSTDSNAYAAAWRLAAGRAHQRDLSVGLRNNEHSLRHAVISELEREVASASLRAAWTGQSLDRRYLATAPASERVYLHTAPHHLLLVMQTIHEMESREDTDWSKLIEAYEQFDDEQIACETAAVMMGSKVWTVHKYLRQSHLAGRIAWVEGVSQPTYLVLRSSVDDLLRRRCPPGYTAWKEALAVLQMGRDNLAKLVRAGRMNVVHDPVRTGSISAIETESLRSFLLEESFGRWFQPVMRLLGDGSCLRTEDVGRSVGVSPATLTRVLHSLEAQHWITLRRANDGIWIEATSEGRFQTSGTRGVPPPQRRGSESPSPHAPLMERRRSTPSSHARSRGLPVRHPTRPVGCRVGDQARPAEQDLAGC